MINITTIYGVFITRSHLILTIAVRVSGNDPTS
jgi:hypothetical protein